MKAGWLRALVEYQTVETTKDSRGAPRRAWVPLGRYWAQIDTLSASEYFTGTREEAAQIWRVTTRTPAKSIRDLADASIRILDVHSGIFYAVVGRVYDRKKTLVTWDCRTGVADG